MPNPHEREAALFALAAEKPDAERGVFLQAVCGKDDALRERLEALLAAHEQPEESPVDGAAAATVPQSELNAREEPPDEAVGQTLGRYKLLERVGEGGCGVVYVAEQTRPVRRRVALKVIKLGMDTREVIARFEAERQALAMMDHPNIAKVLDAGTTELGSPYFVMELVRGIRITDYCDQANLSTRERLDLFIKVCQAIQHAHQKGIIHRDIKPSNVLVTLHDGMPVPKVIDFGIAKATEGRLTEATVYTQLHQFIGTPAYMSPEQAEMSGLDIDTRSDIYSLGVLLYELLAGSTPFDAKALVASGIDAMRKTIREQEPMRPSTRLATLQSEQLTTTAKRRSAETSKLFHQLKGDLDWIVMKCLEKDRTRRYESASGLAADLKRHLDNETVLARPPSTAYRLEKAFRRNKLAFAAGTAIAGALVLGVIGTTVGLLRAKRAEAIAMRSRSDAEKLSNFMLEDFYAELQPSGQSGMVARLAREAVAYYDNLPPSLCTPETDRNRASARARLAIVTAQQGDIVAAMPVAEEAVTWLDRIRQEGDASEGTAYALAVALRAEFLCNLVNSDLLAQARQLQRAVDVLQPFALSAKGTRRSKLEYANLLMYLSFRQTHEQGLASCQEAMHILVGLGALDWKDVDAASACAEVADAQAQPLFGLGRIDETEKLEHQAVKLAEGVIERRPTDLRARQVLGSAPEMLGLIASHRSQDAAALQWFEQSRRANEDYVRFNPSDLNGWAQLSWMDHCLAGLLYRAGRVTEGLALDRAAARVDTDHGNAGSNGEGPWTTIARWEAQRGDREAWENALREGRRSVEAFATRTRMSKPALAFFMGSFRNVERQARLAFGENEAVLKMASNMIGQLEEWKSQEAHPEIAAVFLLWKRQALADATVAALKLERFAEAESTAGTLLALPLPQSAWSERMLFMQPDDLGWGRVLLAQAQVSLGRTAEAMKTLQPALVLYREMKVQGATHLTFRQRFARAHFVRALAQTAGADRRAQSRDSLAEAAKELDGLTEEGRQLQDTKELLSWIEGERKKSGADPEIQQP